MAAASGIANNGSRGASDGLASGGSVGGGGSVTGAGASVALAAGPRGPVTDANTGSSSSAG
jgi:hypothetical protein